MYRGAQLTLLSPSTAKAPGWTSQDALKQLSSYAVENFTLPEEPGFPLNSLYQPPANRMESGTFHSLRQRRLRRPSCFADYCWSTRRSVRKQRELCKASRVGCGRRILFTWLGDHTSSLSSSASR